MVERIASKNKAAKKATATSAKKGVVSDVPCLFRINVEVGNLDEAAAFYGKLFGLKGRKQAGSRCCFARGPVTLQVIDVSSVGKPHPAAKALYFTVQDLVRDQRSAAACRTRHLARPRSGD